MILQTKIKTFTDVEAYVDKVVLTKQFHLLGYVRDFEKSRKTSRALRDLDKTDRLKLYKIVFDLRNVVEQNNKFKGDYQDFITKILVQMGFKPGTPL